jgi:hypothetical protein
MQENKEQIETFDAEKYWNVVEEEERKGNRFLDIAKDVVKFEKATILEFFNIEHKDGKRVDSVFDSLVKMVAMTFGFCITWCLLEWIFGNFNIGTLREALFTFVGMLIFESIVAIPTYFFLKSHPKAKKKVVEFWMAVGILVILLIALAVV